MGPVLWVSLLTGVGQLLSVATQIVAASFFGATVPMDAYVAASAAPQYLIAVILGSISAMTVPWLTDYKSKSESGRFPLVAGQALSWLLAIVGTLSVLGAVFAEQILRVTAPGLSESSYFDVAVRMAFITWPVAPCLAGSSFLAGLAQVRGHYRLVALAPASAALIGLLITALFSPLLGADALAYSTTAAGVVQLSIAALSLRGLRGVKFHLSPIAPELIHLAKLLAPLTLTGLLIRSMPLVDRFIASHFESGTLSHLNYAYKIVTILSAVLATGVATVVFPALARRTADNDHEGLLDTLSLGMRRLWAVVAPVVAIGIALALPVVQTVFQRGAFTLTDAQSVAAFLQVYLIAMIGMTMGTLSSRAMYAMKLTRLLSVCSVIEAIAYVGYATVLVRTLGPIGLAWAAVGLFFISLVWHMVVVLKRTGPSADDMWAMASVSVAAVIGGTLSFFGAQWFGSPVLKCLIGGAVGLGAYGLLILLAFRKQLNGLYMEGKGSGHAVASFATPDQAESNP